MWVKTQELDYTGLRVDSTDLVNRGWSSSFNFSGHLSGKEQFNICFFQEFVEFSGGPSFELEFTKYETIWVKGQEFTKFMRCSRSIRQKTHKEKPWFLCSYQNKDGESISECVGIKDGKIIQPCMNFTGGGMKPQVGV